MNYIMSESTEEFKIEGEKTFFQQIKDEYNENYGVDELEYILASSNVSNVETYINKVDKFKFNIKCLNYLCNSTADNKDYLIDLYLEKVNSIDFLKAIFTTMCHSDIISIVEIPTTYSYIKNSWNIKIDKYLDKLSVDEYVNLLVIIAPNCVNESDYMLTTLMSHRSLSNEQLFTAVSCKINTIFYNAVRNNYSNFNEVLNMQTKIDLLVETYSLPLYVKFLLQGYTVDNTFYTQTLNANGLNLYHILVIENKYQVLSNIVSYFLHTPCKAFCDILNGTDAFGNTPLMLALIQKKFNIVDLFLNIEGIELMTHNSLWSTAHLLYSNILTTVSSANKPEYFPRLDSTYNQYDYANHFNHFNQHIISQTDPDYVDYLYEQKQNQTKVPVPYNLSCIPYSQFVSIPTMYKNDVHVVPDVVKYAPRENYITALKKIFTNSAFEYDVNLATLMITSKYINADLFSLMLKASMRAQKSPDRRQLTYLCSVVDDVSNKLNLSTSSNPYDHYTTFNTLNEIRSLLMKEEEILMSKESKPNYLWIFN